ncbi:MAG TPA: alpha/beta fold hydrolase [Candidatus Angelobacter sp.]|nr:alpha/beta fold hydrolase [Candidatus Angelobacter sp.]
MPKLLCLALLATALRPPQLAPPSFEDQGRTVVMEMAARHFDKVEALFDERVTAALPVEKLAQSWDKLIEQSGEFKAIEKVRSEEKQGYQVVYVTTVFERRRRAVIVVFDTKGRIVQFTSAPAESIEPWTQPAYAHNDKFHEREIQIGSSPWELPGILTLPNGPGPFPAVVLVHGSGPNDRDESIGPTKMFKDLAWGLASRGIAVLRYDKRTRVHGKEMVALAGGFTVNEEVIDDARAAVALLAKQPEIQAKRIFIVGHSLGGNMAPRIADGDPQIAGLIIMAGSTRPMEDLLVEQVRYSVGLSGKTTPEGEKLIAQAEKSAAEMRNPDLKPGMTVDFMGSILPASYVLDLRAYHAAETASRLKIPILVMQGDRYQVGAADLNGWKQALEKKSTVSFKTYPTLNHLFMPGVGPSSDAEYLKPNHVLESVVEDIAGWIVKH